MAYIQNNKHTPSRTVRLPETAALAVLALTLPGMASAQQNTQTLSEVEVTSTVENSYKAETVSSPKFTQQIGRAHV